MDPFTLGWHLPGLVILTGASMWLGWIDLRTHYLPRRIIHLSALLGLPWLMAASVITDRSSTILSMLVGGLGGLCGFGLVHVITRGAFGAGDVRLAGLLGAYLGWIGLIYAPLGLLIGLTLAAGAGGAMVLTGYIRAHDPLPLGPFLIVGAFLTTVYGPAITRLTLMDLSFT
jgi:leader peptidase (prepilin peptidase) / N-methyltransferase